MEKRHTWWFCSKNKSAQKSLYYFLLWILQAGVLWYVPAIINSRVPLPTPAHWCLLAKDWKNFQGKVLSGNLWETGIPFRKSHTMRSPLFFLGIVEHAQKLYSMSHVSSGQTIFAHTLVSTITMKNKGLALLVCRALLELNACKLCGPFIHCAIICIHKIIWYTGYKIQIIISDPL